MALTSFFIPYNVPSSKNSNRWTGKTLIKSKLVMDYYKKSDSFWLEYKENFLEATKNLPKPFKIGFYFVRDSKRKFDYINPTQTIQDRMVKYGWLEDDNCNEIIPVFEGYEIDKTNPGVYINIIL